MSRLYTSYRLVAVSLISSMLVPDAARAQTATAADPENIATIILGIAYNILQAVLGLAATFGIGRLGVRAMDRDRGGVSGFEVIVTLLGATGALACAGIVQFLKARLT